MKNRLKELRRSHHKSQADLARALGVSRQAVNGFESGKFDPSLEMAFKLAQLLSVSIEDIFLYEEAIGPMQTTLKRVKKYFGFERFAQKAINAIKFAGNEAKSAKAPLVQPEHLLAGLLADPVSMSARLLRANGVTHPIDINDHSFEFRGEPKLSAQVKEILDLALHSVQQQGKKSIGTEHVLWGLLQFAQTHTDANQLLNTYDIDTDSLYSQLEAVI